MSKRSRRPWSVRRAASAQRKRAKTCRIWKSHRWCGFCGESVTDPPGGAYWWWLGFQWLVHIPGSCPAGSDPANGLVPFHPSGPPPMPEPSTLAGGWMMFAVLATITAAAVFGLVVMSKWGVSRGMDKKEASPATEQFPSEVSEPDVLDFEFEDPEDVSLF